MKMKKVKRIKSGFLAMVLGLSMMMAAVPGKVAEAADAERTTKVLKCHCGLYTTNYDAVTTYSFQGSDGHIPKLTETFTCIRGHATEVVTIYDREGHSWNRNKWTSLWHKNANGDGYGTHAYEITCTQCYWNQTVTLLCNYESSGYHTTPY